MAKRSTKHQRSEFAQEIRIAIDAVEEESILTLVLTALSLWSARKAEAVVDAGRNCVRWLIRRFHHHTDRNPAMPPHLWGEERAAGGGGGGGWRPEGSDYYIELFWVRWPFIPYMHRVALDHPRTQAETIVSSLLSVCYAMVYLSFLGGYLLYITASGLLGYLSYAFAYYGDWQRALTAISGAIVMASLVYVSAWYMTRPPVPVRARAG